MMKEHFKEQLEKVKPLTTEIIEQLVSKQDYFGVEYKPGHIVVYGIIQKEETPEHEAQFGSSVNMRIVRITDTSLTELEENYEFIRHAGDGQHLPVFTLKGE